MLENAIKNFNQYAPFLRTNTINGLAKLVLENASPSEALLKNLVLRDTNQISSDEFLQKEIERILNEKSNKADSLPLKPFFKEDKKLYAR